MEIACETNLHGMMGWGSETEATKVPRFLAVPSATKMAINTLLSLLGRPSRSFLLETMLYMEYIYIYIHIYLPMYLSMYLFMCVLSYHVVSLVNSIAPKRLLPPFTPELGLLQLHRPNSCHMYECVYMRFY